MAASDPPGLRRFRVGVDIGGTFTDLVLIDDAGGELTVGKVLTTPADPSSAVAELRDKDIQAIAVCFVHSYANPAHERLVGDIIREVAPGVRVSLSSDVVPEIREYERTSTTVVNVYVQGLVEGYLAELVRRLRELEIGGELLLMLSSGGISTVETATRFPLRLLESGPAGGALASAYFGQLANVANLLAFDMGGTTAKLCVIENGRPLTSTEFEVD